MNINIEEGSIIVLVGAMGTGKSSFCDHFELHHIISSDEERENLCGDFEDQTVSKPAFEILFAKLEVRARFGFTTVVDSTGTQPVIDRARELAKQHKRPLVMIRFPHLDDSLLVRDHMEHRMRYLDAYHRQVSRIDNKTVVYKEYTVHDLPPIGPERDAVRVHFKTADEDYRLNADMNYVVVPDLHGEHMVLSHYADMFGDREDYRFIQLGDIVDRGDSSYKTFKLVNRMVQSGRMVVCRSNHDNKFYRWLTKWMKDEARNTRDIDGGSHHTYGMKIADGLEDTLEEFYGFDEKKREAYATEFIYYWENLTEPYYFIENDDHFHFFAHAGFSRSLLMGLKPTKADESHVMYNTMHHASELAMMCERIGRLSNKTVTLHLGHDWVANMVTSDAVMSDGRHIAMMKHDIGLGKRLYYDASKVLRAPEETIPEFHIILKGE